MFDLIIGFFRDTISGTYYTIYAIILSVLMFSIVGYLFKQKYAKVEFKLNDNTKPKTVKKTKEKKSSKKKSVVTSNSKVVASKTTSPSTSVQAPPSVTLPAANAKLPPITGTSAPIPDVANQGK